MQRRYVTITRPEQQTYKEERARGSPIDRSDTSQKLGDVGHAAEIRGDVDGIGDDEQRRRMPNAAPVTE